jgi:hypothetical protein
MNFVGIDNGKQGAIAIIDGSFNRLWLRKMPSTEVGIYNALSQWGSKGLTLGTSINTETLTMGPIVEIESFAIVEAVPFLPAAIRGHKSAMQLGINHGIILGILTALRISYETIRVGTWRKAFGITGKDPAAKKAAAITIAQRLFPGVNLRATPQCRKDDHNMAEALLMAEYGRRIHGRA